MQNLAHHRIPFLLGLAGAGVACGSSDGTPDDTRGDGPLYAVTSQILGQDTSSYVALVPDLRAQVDVDLSTVLEVPGRAIGVGPTGGAAILVATDGGPTLTRYTITADGGFERGQTLSFANEGVGTLLAFAQQFVFLSDKKAYFLDDTDGAQIIVFNPTEMLIEKTVPVPSVTREGWGFTYGLSAILRGTELVFTVSYYKLTESVFDRETRLVVVDTTTDTVTFVQTETRCSYLLSSVAASNGDIYFASNVYTSIVEEVLGPSFGGPSCVLVLRAGESEFDPDFRLDLRAAAGGEPVGTLVPGPAGKLYVRVLDRSTVPSGATFATPVELSNGAFWRWAELDVSAQRITPLDLQPGAAQAVEYRVEDRVLVGVSTANFASTTLIDFSGPTPTRGMTFVGIPFAVVRVR